MEDDGTDMPAEPESEPEQGRTFVINQDDPDRGYHEEVEVRNCLRCETEMEVKRGLYVLRYVGSLQPEAGGLLEDYFVRALHCPFCGSVEFVAHDGADIGGKWGENDEEGNKEDAVQQR